MDDEIRRRILNWAAWARDHKIIPVSCRSLECHYIAPPVWYYPELRKEIDLLDALHIERTITGETFPKANMAVIVYAYIYPWLNFQAALRRINRFKAEKPVNRHNFDSFQRKSEIILENRL